MWEALVCRIWVNLEKNVSLLLIRECEVGHGVWEDEYGVRMGG